MRLTTSTRNKQHNLLYSVIVITFLFVSVVPAGQKNKKDRITGTPVIWQDRGDTSSLDLFYGCGSQERAPKPPFKFLKENMTGTNPKFDVTDARGVTWGVKLGDEAQPETSVTRLLWSMGYFTDEDYYVTEFSVIGLKKLNRGMDLLTGHGTFRGGRF